MKGLWPVSCVAGWVLGREWQMDRSLVPQWRWPPAARSCEKSGKGCDICLERGGGSGGRAEAGCLTVTPGCGQKQPGHLTEGLCSWMGDGRAQPESGPWRGWRPGTEGMQQRLLDGRWQGPARVRSVERVEAWHGGHAAEAPGWEMAGPARQVCGEGGGWARRAHSKAG